MLNSSKYPSWALTKNLNKLRNVLFKINFIIIFILNIKLGFWTNAQLCHFYQLGFLDKFPGLAFWTNDLAGPLIWADHCVLLDDIR